MAAEHDENEAGARQEYSQGARNRKIFTATDEVFGLPSNVAVFGAAFVGMVFVISTWWGAAIAALIYFQPMYAIHKDDPRAFEVWIKVLSERHTAWEAGTASARTLVIIRRDQ